jgi:RNA polymerase sigma-70 factor (ECF subfamily)
MSRTDTGFDSLYERYHRSILAYCLRRTSRADAYEAANETFSVAWRRYDDMPSGDRALPWLYAVARRVLSHQRRSATRFARLAVKATSVPIPHPPGPDAVVVQRQEYATVIAAIGRLRPDDREMLFLSAWEGLTHAEIASTMGYSLAAVDKRLARAKQRLKRQYEALYATEMPRPPSAVEGGGSA